VVLLGLVLRALGVALLTATILLPIADHHTASRLPEALVKPLSVHDVLTHHHNHTQKPTATTRSLELTGLPSVLPSTTSWAEGAGAPFAALATFRPGDHLARLGFVPVNRAALPPSVDRAPPVPPPLLPA
jgi:hypothetical protein